MEKKLLKKTVKRNASSDFQSENKEYENKKIKLIKLPNKDCDNDNIKPKEDLNILKQESHLKNEELSSWKGDCLNSNDNKENQEGSSIQSQEEDENSGSSIQSQEEDENSGSSIEPQVYDEYNGISIEPQDYDESNEYVVTPEVAATFLKEKDKYEFIDTRYPYEYDGGHIEGSINLYTPLQAIKHIFGQNFEDNFESTDENFQKIMDKIVDDYKYSSRRLSRKLIFYSENSSERAKMIKKCVQGLDFHLTLRRVATKSVENIVPNIVQSSVPYLRTIIGGYRAFHSIYNEFCSPKAYIKADNIHFKEDYVKYEIEINEHREILDNIFAARFLIN